MDDRDNAMTGLPSRIAGIALLGAGVLDLAVVLQLVLFAWQQDAFIVTAEVLFVVMGVAQVGCGAQVYGSEFVYTVLAVPVGAAGALVGGGWFLTLILLDGAISPLSLVAGAASMLAVLTSLGALPTAKRISKARREPD